MLISSPLSLCLVCIHILPRDTDYEMDPDHPIKNQPPLVKAFIKQNKTLKKYINPDLFQ